MWRYTRAILRFDEVIGSRRWSIANNLFVPWRLRRSREFLMWMYITIICIQNLLSKHVFHAKRKSWMSSPHWILHFQRRMFVFFSFFSQFQNFLLLIWIITNSNFLQFTTNNIYIIFFQLNSKNHNLSIIRTQRIIQRKQ